MMNHRIQKNDSDQRLIQYTIKFMVYMDYGPKLVTTLFRIGKYINNFQNVLNIVVFSK